MLPPAASASLSPAPGADPVREPGRGTLRLFGGVLVDALRPRHRRVKGLAAAQVLQCYARVLILEEGETEPREAILAPLAPLTADEIHELDAETPVDLVAQSNLAASVVLHDEAEVAQEIRLREFEAHIRGQDALEFLFANLAARGAGATFNLFAACFAPGGEIDGLGVYLNTWL